MPEIVFAVVGATATGLAGISPDARQHTVETLSRLPKEVQWVKLVRVPVLENEVTVRHRGVAETTFTNQAGPPIQWKASFPLQPTDTQPQLILDGKPVRANIELGVNRQRVVSALVPVGSGQTRTVKAKLTVN